MKKALILVIILLSTVITNSIFSAETKYKRGNKEYRFFYGIFDGCHKDDVICNQIDKEVDIFTDDIQKLFENGDFVKLAEKVDMEIDLNLFKEFPKILAHRKDVKMQILSALKSSPVNEENRDTWEDQLNVSKKVNINRYLMKINEMSRDDIGYSVPVENGMEDFVVFSFLEEGDELNIVTPYTIDQIAKIYKGSFLLDSVLFTIGKANLASVGNYYKMKTIFFDIYSDYLFKNKIQDFDVYIGRINKSCRDILLSKEMNEALITECMKENSGISI